MLNPPKNRSRGVEQCDIRTDEATGMEMRKMPPIIDCQICHLLTVCEWEGYEICCVIPLWRRITSSICLIWHLPTLYKAILAVPTENNRNTEGCHLFPLSSIKTLSNQSLILFSVYQSPPHPLLRSITVAKQPVCDQTLSVLLLNPELTLAALKRIRRTPGTSPKFQIIM